MAENDLQFIELSERAYKYIRQFTIKSSEDALVELITNCIDAYNKESITPRKIFIDYINPNILKVRDYAIGLTSTEMKQCFLQVGNYTNTTDSRGFFSRGAKDISAIGDLTFHAIKDGKYSKCILNHDAYGLIEIEDINADSTIRNSVGIPEPNNGLEVVVKLLDNFIITNKNQHIASLQNIASLRDIMIDQNNEIHYNVYDTLMNQLSTQRLTFSYPPGSLLLQLEYTVPNYPEATAEFVVYRANTPIPQPAKENEMIFGFLIKDYTTVYEVNTIDDRFRWNPYMNVVYGYLKCDHIAKLLRDYDTIGATEKNPVPIIDPSRLTGVNKDHPFIDSLFSIPRVRLDQILRELNESLSQQSITLQEVDQLLEELSKYGLNIIEEEEIQLNFISDYDKQLVKAIEEDRANYVNKEKSYLLNNSYNTQQLEIDRYVEEQIVKLKPEGGGSFVLTDENDLIEIPNMSDDLNDPVNILELIPSNQTIEKNPYIYRLSPDGELTKLYIFEKGLLDDIINPENDYVKMKNKKFRISFINDINIDERYLIEYDDGIHIKLNLNNTNVKKYLMTPNITSGNVDLSVKNISSSKSLTFLQELIIEIFAEIILENDIMNSKIVLDSNNYNNSKKILTHRNKLTAKVELPIDSIFDKYIADTLGNKKTQIFSKMGEITAKINEKINVESDGDLLLLKTEYENLLDQLIE